MIIKPQRDNCCGPCVVSILAEPIYTLIGIRILGRSSSPKNNKCVNMTKPRLAQAACVSDVLVDVDKRFTIAHNFMRRRKPRALHRCLLTSLSEGQCGYWEWCLKFAEFLAGFLNTWKHSHPNNHSKLRSVAPLIRLSSSSLCKCECVLVYRVVVWILFAEFHSIFRALQYFARTFRGIKLCFMW